MTTKEPARSPFPQARWKFERTDNGLRLVLWPARDTERYEVLPFSVPMNDDEAWYLVRGLDRVTSWAAPHAEGTFTAGPTPAQAAGQLSIGRYLVTSPDGETHTRMVQATSWANWVEQWSADAEGVTWLVNVFAVDDHQFLQVAMTHSVTVRAFAPVPGGKEA